MTVNSVAPKDALIGLAQVRKLLSFFALDGTVRREKGGIIELTLAYGHAENTLERNFQRFVCFLPIDSTKSEKPSCLPPIFPGLALRHAAIAKYVKYTFQSLLKK